MELWEELGWTQGRSGPLSFCQPSHRQTGMALVDIFSRIRGILMPLMILLGEHHVSLLVLIYSSLPIGAGLLGPADRDTWPDPEGHCRRPGARILTTVRCLLSLNPGPHISGPSSRRPGLYFTTCPLLQREPSQFPYFAEEVARNEDST